jgi:hypothetical protein
VESCVSAIAQHEVCGDEQMKVGKKVNGTKISDERRCKCQDKQVPSSGNTHNTTPCNEVYVVLVAWL